MFFQLIIYNKKIWFFLISWIIVIFPLSGANTHTRLPAVHPLRITSLHNTVSFFSQLIKPEENWWTWDMVHIKTYFINHWGEFYEKEVFGLGELWHHNEPMPGSIFFLFLWFKLNSRLKVWRCYSDRDGSETNKQTPGKWLCTQVPLGFEPRTYFLTTHWECSDRDRKYYCPCAELFTSLQQLFDSCLRNLLMKTFSRTYYCHV